MACRPAEAATLCIGVLLVWALAASAQAAEGAGQSASTEESGGAFSLPATASSGPESALSAVAAAAPQLLARYIATDTVNPPGNEIEGARLLAAILDREGISAQILESAPGRANLVARLPGTGAKRPLILLSHIDVVPAQADQWSAPPFAGQIRDGLVFGRGALDAKGIGVIQLLATVALKRMGVTLDRDVIFVATAGEESGGSVGVKWLLEHHPELVGDAELVLNEGGLILREPDKPLVFHVSVAEKGPCWFAIKATGSPGHGSRPAAETSVSRLVVALHKLLGWERPYRVGPIVAGYYAAYARLDPDHARQLRQLERSLEDHGFYDWFVADPTAAALIRDTVTPTVLRGSAKTNIVPAQATAEVDARLLPGSDCNEFLNEVRGLIAGEFVKVEPLDVAFAPSASPVDGSLMQAIERLGADEPEGAIVLPSLLTGFTDSHYFRERGIAAYGFVPLVISPSQRDSVHGPDENVGADELSAAVRRLVHLLRDLGG